MLARMIHTAAWAHKDRVDKSGHPEILHPLRVGMKLYEMGCPAAVVYAGFLHDVLEDTYTTAEKLEADLINNRMDDETRYEVMFYTVQLTHRTGESYEDYIRRIAKYDVLRTIKRVDIRDNQTRDHKGITAKKLEEMRAKYNRALSILEEYDVSEEA